MSKTKGSKPTGRAARKASASRKRRIDLILSISMVVAFAAVITFAIIYTKKQEDAQPKTSVELLPERDYSEEAAAYSAGLNADGSIVGIDDIDAYVTLPELSDITLYLGDYPVGTDKEKAEAGSHVIDLIAEAADIKEYTPYFESLKDLYAYMIHGWYDSYVEAHESTGKELEYKTFEEYLLKSEGMDTEAYESFCSEGARMEMRRFLTVEALAKRYSLSADDEEILSYAKVADFHARNDELAANTVKRFGEPYMHQRTIEYKLELLIIDEVTRKEGSIKDEWEDLSRIYSAGLYSNGRIEGIGDIKSYVSLADTENVTGGHEFGSSGIWPEELTRAFDFSEQTEEKLGYYLENSEIGENEDYKEKLADIFVTAFGGDRDAYKEEAAKECRRRLVIQALFDDAGLKTEDFRAGFFADMDSEAEQRLEYTYGEACVNLMIMEFAIRKTLKP